MTPKEYALDLANKMYEGNIFKQNKEERLKALENAQKCTLIAVDEIIRISESQNETSYFTGDKYVDFESYFRDVKMEIFRLLTK